MPRHPKLDRSILEAALIGLQHARAEIETKMTEVRQQLGEGAAQDGTQPARKKRVLSAAARRRIAAAQRRRWAAVRKEKSL
jgi:hypothetical protein